MSAGLCAHRVPAHGDVSIVEVDILLSLGGLFAGLLVGLTGMGGAVIVTPMLVLLFGVPPAAAISADLVAGAVVKPVGALVHLRARTVHWHLVLWISVGSVPGVLIGTWLFARIVATSHADSTLRFLVGVVILVAVIAMVGKKLVERRVILTQQLTPSPQGTDMPIRPSPAIVVGALVGLIVGLTSVGSGSLVVTALMLSYPLLRSSVLVGTDLAQAVPMLVVGAVAHAGFGEILVPVVVSLLIGQIPGVWIGARVSARYDGSALRWLLIAVLAATAAKLLGASSAVSVVVGVVGIVAVGLVEGVGRRPPQT